LGEKIIVGARHALPVSFKELPRPLGRGKDAAKAGVLCFYYFSALKSGAMKKGDAANLFPFFCKYPLTNLSRGLFFKQIRTDSS
jgi:hypothetical protein